MTGRKRSFTRGRDGGSNKRAWLLAAIYSSLLTQYGTAQNVTASGAKALQDERGLILSDENGKALIAI